MIGCWADPITNGTVVDWIATGVIVGIVWFALDLWKGHR